MGRQGPKRADRRVAEGVRVEELHGSWLALDPTGGIVHRLEACAAEVMRLVAHRPPLPGHLVPGARELAGHGVLEHALVDRRTAMIGAGVVTRTGLAATLLPGATVAASVSWGEPNAVGWPLSSSGPAAFTSASVDGRTSCFNALTMACDPEQPFMTRTRVVRNIRAIEDVSIPVGGGGGGVGTPFRSPVPGPPALAGAAAAASSSAPG